MFSFLKKIDINIFLLILLSILFWFFYSRLEPLYLSNPDSAKYASVGRNIKDGKGIIIGYALNTEKIGPYGKFSFTSPPLYSLILSVNFRLFGNSDSVIINTSGFFYIGCLIFIYLLGKKIFDKRVGFLSSIAFMLNSEFIQNSLSGNADSLFVFIFLIIVYLLTYNNLLSIFILGIATCLLITAKIQGVLYLPFIFLLLLMTTSKKRIFNSVILFSIVFLVFYIFLYLEKIPIPPPRNFSIHNLFYLFFYNSSVYPGGSIDQAGNINTLVNNNILRAVFSKIITNIYYIIKSIPTITSPFLIILFILSFLKEENKINQKLKTLMAILFLFLLCFSAVTVLNLRYVYPVFPIITIFAINFFIDLVTRYSTNGPQAIKRLKIFYIIFFIIFPLTQLNLGAKILKNNKNTGEQNLYFKIGQIFREFSKNNELIGTNVEIWGTWYGERKTVLIPHRIKDLREVDYVLLSSYSPGTSLSREWQQLFDKPKNYDDLVFRKKFFIPDPDNYQNIPVTMILYENIK